MKYDKGSRWNTTNVSNARVTAQHAGAQNADALRLTIHFAMLTLVVLAALCFASGVAYASKDGIEGYSSSPHTTAGSSCLACHTPSSNVSAALSISGPSVVNANSLNRYTLTLTGGPAASGGVGISVDKFDGELQTVNGDLRRFGNDLSHRMPKAFSGGQVQFQFDWRAPSYNASTRIYAAANSADGNLNLIRDAIATTGMDVRIVNGSGSRPADPNPSNAAIRLKTFATGLSQPVSIASAGDDRLFVVEQTGRIKVVDGRGNVLATPFLDIVSRVSSIGEQGLLGLAFHPNYASNGYFYVYYIHATGGNYRTRVSRFSVSSNRNVANHNSESILFEIVRNATNHNGGDIRFDRNGYLMIANGDDANRRHSQNTTNLPGKILRIDVNGAGGPNNGPDCGLNGRNYRIPPGNAFNDGAGGGCDEIFALGLRNPWRISIDRQTGDLWIADVGQSSREEVNFVRNGTTGGLNLGWPCFEGDQTFDSTGCNASYYAPVHSYDRNVGVSITGGFVYRGNQFPDLHGRYFYTDYGRPQRIYSLSRKGSEFIASTVLDNSGKSSFSSFGEDNNGELYLVSRGAGELYQIESTSVGGTSLLSVSSATVTEGINDRARVTVRMSPASSSTVTVRLSTEGRTAQPGADYVGVSRTLSFAPGETSKTVDVDIVDDNVVEPTEYFDAVLARPTGGARIDVGSARVTVNDDDVASRPRVWVEDKTVNESAGNVQVKVSLSENSPGGLAVDFRTVADTARAGSDFESFTRRLNFLVGQRSQTLTIDLVDDAVREAREQFFVRLSNPSGLDIQDDTGVVTIEDDDTGGGTARFDVASTTVNEADGTASVRVTLSVAQPDAVSVKFATVGDSAVPNEDYYGVFRTLTFAAGETAKSVAVTVLDDTAVEGDETILTRLFEPNGALLGEASGTIVIRDNDGGSTVTVSAADFSTTEGVGTVRIPVRLSEQVSGPVSVRFATTPGTAVPGQDYVGRSGSIAFQPGSLESYATVQVVDDTNTESLESFSIRLFDPVGVVIADEDANVTIRDNDGGTLPTLSVDARTFRESAGKVAVAVRLSRMSSVPITVSYATEPFSATPGVDYYGARNTLRFEPGELAKDAVVELLDDQVSEPIERFYLGLFDAKGGAGYGQRRSLITIADDD